MNKTLTGFILVVALILGSFLGTMIYRGVAYAQGSGSGLPAVSTRLSSDTIVSENKITSHDQVVDPVSDPGGALSALKNAWSKGWFAFVIMLVFLGVKLIGRVGSEVKSLAWLNTGRSAMIVAGLTVVLASCVDTVAAGGSYTNVGVAALVALLGFMSPHATNPQTPS